jgi:hypothetical protein
VGELKVEMGQGPGVFEKEARATINSEW